MLILYRDKKPEESKEKLGLVCQVQLVHKYILKVKLTTHLLQIFQKMRGEEVILLNFPISHFLKSLAHSALIYMRGVKSENLLAVVDFLYRGEANVYQENFLAIAEEFQLKGLMGQT